MLQPNEKLPGVTFHVNSSRLQGKIGYAVLDAQVEDVDLWDKVLAKLDKFRVYTVTDLQTAMIEVLQMDEKEEQERHAIEVESLRSELERVKQRLSVLEKVFRELEGAMNSCIVRGDLGVA